MGVVTGLIVTLRHAFGGGKFLAQTEARFKALELQHADFKELLEAAGEKSSTLASHVQGLPAQWQNDCVTRREADVVAVEARLDRQRMQREIEQLWSALRRRS